jgi:5-methylcytosine-specific restriction endonuclease McrA
VMHSTQKWSDVADAKLQDCLASTDWKCIDDIVPTVNVYTCANQKPWITGNIRTEVKARPTTFKERDTNADTYMKARYNLQRAIKQSKHQYGTKIKSYSASSDSHQMW